MAAYPLVLRPHRIEEILSNSSGWEAPPERPPEPPPSKYKLPLLILESALAVVASAWLAQSQPPYLWVSVAAAFTLILLGQVWWQQRTYPQRLQRYRVHLRESRNIAEQEPQQRKFNSIAQVLAKFGHKQGYPQEQNWDGHGRTEPAFLLVLNKYFQQIHTDLKFDGYIPDFAYKHPQVNLWIDIEIDEPYTKKDGRYKLIHCIGEDNHRNNCFLQRGWVVIRFAEEQVAKYPESCCKVIAQTIFDLTGDATSLSMLSTEPDLPSIKQWTEAEAEQMQKEKWRGRYLNESKIELRSTKPIKRKNQGDKIPL